MTFIKRLGEVPNPDWPPILPTGLSALDRLRCFRVGCPDVVVLGARPGKGKTLLASQIAYEVSKHAPVLFISLEMSAEQIRGRLSRSPGFSPDTDFLIADPEALYIDDLIELLNAQHQETPLALVVVDYVQIILVEGRTKAEEVAESMRKFKTWAKANMCPVLLIAQLNRGIESRGENSNFIEPMMSDFADSAGVESWADIALIMHPRPNTDGLIHVEVVKNRHGAKGHLTIKLEERTLMFVGHEEF